MGLSYVACQPQCVPLATFSEPVQARISYFKDPANWFKGDSAQKAWCYVVGTPFPFNKCCINIDKAQKKSISYNKHDIAIYSNFLKGYFVLDKNTGIGTKTPMCVHPNPYNYSPYPSKPSFVPTIEYNPSNTDRRMDKILSYLHTYTTPAHIFSHPADICRTTRLPRQPVKGLLRSDFRGYRLLYT